MSLVAGSGCRSAAEPHRQFRLQEELEAEAQDQGGAGDEGWG